MTAEMAHAIMLPCVVIARAVDVYQGYTIKFGEGPKTKLFTQPGATTILRLASKVNGGIIRNFWSFNFSFTLACNFHYLCYSYINKLT